jgi:hypothetical protein
VSNGQRSDLWLTNVTVDGTSLGVFDKKSGGSMTGQETKYRPGGSATQVSLGGPVDVENVTVSRIYVRERDHVLSKQLMGRVGKAVVTVAQQPLDENLTPWGAPIVYTGRLTKITVPDADSNSQGASLFELEVSTQGTIS